MQPEISKALSYWQVAMQYLDLSENVATLISSTGNKWVFIQEGFDTEALEKEHAEATKWTDYNQGIPVIFNFYHGLELLLKGFLIAAGESAKGHRITELHAKLKELYPDEIFLTSIEQYINPVMLPDVLKSFTEETSISIDEWFQAFKYPESNKGEIYAHNKLQYQVEKGADFFENLAKDIHQIRVSSVKFARNTHEGLA